MKKTVWMSAAKKARIALAVMAVCGMSFVGAQEAFAAIEISGTNNTITDAKNSSTVIGTDNELKGGVLDGEKTDFNVVESRNASTKALDSNDNLLYGDNIDLLASLKNSNVIFGYNIKLSDYAYNSVVVGSDNELSSTGAHAVVVGKNNKAMSYWGVTIGHGSELGQFGSVVVGSLSKATGEAACVFGVRSNATGKYSVALGSHSTADEDNTVSVGGMHEVQIGNKPNGEAIMETQWLKRRITNVADGTNDTDAATVGQVKNMIAAGGSASFDGTKLNTDIQNVDVAGGYKDTVTNPNADTKGTVAGAINSAYQAGKEYTDTQLTDKVGIIAGGTYVEAGKNVAENIGKLDTQVKANADAIGIANTNITNVDNKIGSLSADGTYIKKAKNVSANLVELDKQVNTNATALTNKADLDLSNINAAGKDVIINLAGNKAGEVLDVKLGAITSTHYVNAGNTVNANISALDTQLNKVENKVGTMTDGNYISAGNTVAGNLSALDAQLKNNTDAIADKADKNLSNITDAGKDVIRDLANEKAGELVDSKLGTITSENYVNAGNTVNANISKLDEQVKANADAINTKADKDLSNITDAGKNVIKDLASVKAGEVVDAKLGDITSNNYVNAGNTVNANISALDKQMKVNTDNIGDTGKLTTAGLGSNLSDAVVNVNNKVGTADELKALKDAGLGDNLAQATAAVNKKADKNAEDIKTVNGRVDDLGGRVDTLGGAVSKLDTKVNKVGAGAAALAALHPMDFDSDNKLTFAAGVGSYHGASAAAIGAFYRPSEQVMFSISGNMGNGENMVNAGVSFALDRPSKTPTTKAALVKTVAAQNEQIAALSETVAEQNEKIARLEAMVEKLAAKQNA